MADIAFLAIIVAFFILCAGYAQLCSHIVGDDDVADTNDGTRTAAPAEQAA